MREIILGTQAQKYVLKPLSTKARFTLGPKARLTLSRGGVEWSGVEWSGVEWSGVGWGGVGWGGLGSGRVG